LELDLHLRPGCHFRLPQLRASNVFELGLSYLGCLPRSWVGCSPRKELTVRTAVAYFLRVNFLAKVTPSSMSLTLQCTSPEVRYASRVYHELAVSADHLFESHDDVCSDPGSRFRWRLRPDTALKSPDASTVRRSAEMSHRWPPHCIRGHQLATPTLEPPVLLRKSTSARWGTSTYLDPCNPTLPLHVLHSHF
jgi:hypothetical protein